MTNGHTCGGEQSGRASEKKGHRGGSWLFLPPGGLEQQFESKMPTCTLQCRRHVTGALNMYLERHPAEVMAGRPDGPANNWDFTQKDFMGVICNMFCEALA